MKMLRSLLKSTSAISRDEWLANSILNISSARETSVKGAELVLRHDDEATEGR